MKRDLIGVSLLVAGLAGCTERPVVAGESTSGRQSLAAYPLGEFTTADILLVIDDSPSMADKQRLLADLFAAVLEDEPYMEEADGTFSGRNRFPFDTHIGVITTSLAIPGVGPGRLDRLDRVERR